MPKDPKLARAIVNIEVAAATLERAAKKKRGRPPGWRKDGPKLDHVVYVSLSEDQRGWLRAQADAKQISEAAVMRGLLDARRACAL